MTQKQNKGNRPDWKALLGEDEDFLKVLVRETRQGALPQSGRWLDMSAP